jgi:16S rRNA (adenine1518-N6/adenine1519-N6)-dimethyltransferase
MLLCGFCITFGAFFTIMVHAKKSFGQHFLKDEPIAARIAEAVPSLPDCHKMLEIGPGTGMLTKQLLKREGYRLSVIDADRDMIAYQEKHFPELAGRIHFGDVLAADLPALMGDGPFVVAGNFPYNISSQILVKVVDNRTVVPALVGMFQREMAERVCAPPNNKVYGALSVLVQAFYRTEFLFGVKPGSFNPPPKVQSAVIRLTRRDEPLGCDEQRFRTLVRTAFGQRRKMLRNTMTGFFPKEILSQDSFFTQRPEQLGVADFVRLTDLSMGRGPAVL